MPSARVDYRLIARREESDSFRDFAKRDSTIRQPNARVARKPGSAFRLRRSNTLATNACSILGLPQLPAACHYHSTVSSVNRPVVLANAEGYTFQLSTQYQMSRKWELDLTLNGEKTLLKGKAVETKALLFNAGQVVLNRSETLRDEQSRVLIAQAEVSGVEVHWDIPHHLLFGFSATGVNEGNVFLSSDPDVDPFAINPFAPSYGRAAPIPILERDSGRTNPATLSLCSGSTALGRKMAGNAGLALRPHRPVR